MQPFISYHIRLTREYPSLTDVLITTAGDYKKISAEKMLTDSSMKQQRGIRCIINRVILYFTCVVLLFFSQMFSSAVSTERWRPGTIRLRVKIDQGLSISWASLIGDQFPILPILPLRMDFEEWLPVPSESYCVICSVVGINIHTESVCQKEAHRYKL